MELKLPREGAAFWFVPRSPFLLWLYATFVLVKIKMWGLEVFFMILNGTCGIRFAFSIFSWNLQIVFCALILMTLLYFLSVLRTALKLLGPLTNLFIWRQSYLRQELEKIHLWLVKDGVIVSRKDRLELQNFPILTGLGISQWFIFQVHFLT